MTKNYGLNISLEEGAQDGSEWQFGAAETNPIVKVPYSERLAYLPKGEIQRGAEDMMDCATRGPLNKLEMDFTYAYKNKLLAIENLEWLKDNGYADEEGNVTFSDAFNAIKSGTTRNGNSIKAPLQSIHNDGLIPKKLLPLESNMTWAEYHDPERITPAIEKLAKEFTSRFVINYEQVRDWAAAYKEILVVAGYAWPEPINGVYPKSDLAFNHVFVRIHPEFFAFDNYTDSVDGDFIKKLASDFVFYKYAYRVYISAENPDPVTSSWPIDLTRRLKRFSAALLSLPFGSTEPKPLNLKTLIYTTSKTRWFLKYYSAAIKIMKTTEGVIINEFETQYINPKNLKPPTIIDSKGDVKIDHDWFYKTFTAPAAAKGYNNIGLHLSDKDSREWGLDKSINGIYWNDTNAYFEFYFIADKGERSAKNRTDLPQWLRLFLHECAHGFIHFSGCKLDLIKKFGLSQYTDEHQRDPVHHFDYKLHDVAKIFSEISFRKWSLRILIAVLLKQAFSIFIEQNESGAVTTPTENQTPKKSKRELLLAAAYAKIGTDVTPKDIVSDEVACAESVCTLLQQVIKDFPMVTYTPYLKKEFLNNHNFKSTLDLKPGNIIISPTKTGNGKLSNGHVGIILNDGKIASNTSKTGLWEANYTINSWIDRYRIYGGMPVFVFELV